MAVDKGKMKIALYVVMGVIAALSIGIAGVGAAVFLNIDKYFPATVEVEVRKFFKTLLGGDEDPMYPKIALSDDMKNRPVRGISDIKISAYLSVALGCLSVAVPVAGILGAYYDKATLLLVYFICSAVLVCLMLCCSMIVYTQRSNFRNFVVLLTLGETMSQSEPNVKKILDTMHANYECCSIPTASVGTKKPDVKPNVQPTSGGESKRDVTTPDTPSPQVGLSIDLNYPPIPSSCCRRQDKQSVTKKCTEDPKQLYEQNCAKVLSKSFSRKVKALMGLGIAYSIIQVAIMTLIYVYVEYAE